VIVVAEQMTHILRAKLEKLQDLAAERVLVNSLPNR
jgi:hypothetical protein